MTALSRPPLTDRQRDVRDFIREFRTANGYCPSVREVMRRFGFDSPNGAMSHLIPLRRKGYIQWEDGKVRTLRVVEDAE